MSSALSRSGPRWLRVASACSGVALVANGLRLRQRAHGLATAPPLASAPAATVGERSVREGSLTAEWRLITVRGVEVGAGATSAAVAWAEDQDLDAADLVPGDLTVERALDLLRQVDPEVYRTNPLVEGRTAGHAVLVRDELAKRAQFPAGPVEPAELVEIARQVKRYAPRSSDLVVVPGLRARPEDPADRRAVHHAVWDRYSSLSLGISAAQLGLLGVGAVAAPAFGLPALAAYLAQPLLVHGGHTGGLRPPDLVGHSARRWVDEVARLVRTVRAPSGAPPAVRAADELRPQYAAEVEAGLDRFFEERVEACPWCGSGDLTQRIEAPDLIQHKPGRFVLDECGRCGHVFQNPRLSLEGLDYYYRDFYDGFGGPEFDRMFAAGSPLYDERIEFVGRYASDPRRWLDVGTGHGHFCLVAQGRWPDTSFEGIDIGDAVEEAADRGWVDRGHRGLFPELAPQLAGRFDVVSMHHYLEHTRDPKAELDAAATALEPGGHLLIEVPDPENAWSRILGNRWIHWMQPQHQHFVSIDRLEEALRERGFAPVARDRGRSNEVLDVAGAIWLSLGQIAPRPGLPWLPPPTPASRVRRAAAAAVAVPLMVVVAVADRLVDTFGRPTGAGPAYRVLARYDGPPDGPTPPDRTDSP